MNSDVYEQYRIQYEKELFENCLKFWLDNGIDNVYGGVYTALTREGTIYTPDKSVWLNGRCLWIFSHLCSVYGERSEWKEAAQLCKSFLDRYCIDPADGRMYFTVTGDGRPLRKRRYIFSETFYIMGNAAYSKAFNDSTALENARKYYKMILSIYRDRSTDPSHPAPKFNPEVRSMRAFAETMILLNVTHVMEECDKALKKYYYKEAVTLTQDILTYFYREDLKSVLENVTMDGQYDSDSSQGRFVNPGHIMECVWFLVTQMERSGDVSLLPQIENMFQWSLDIGWDDKHEGMVYFKDLMGYTPEALEHDMKVWWVTCEMLIASLRLYEFTKKKKYWDWFVRLDSYATRCFRDPNFGEWFGYLHNDNTPTEPICKGNMFKGPFHVPRMLSEVERCLKRLAKQT